jgi:hypothetical protein
LASARAEARSAALLVQIEALAEQQALATHDDEHDPEGVTIGFERAQLLGLSPGHGRRSRHWTTPCPTFAPGPTAVASTADT